MKRNAKSWICRLGLERHPEGGWFRETYRAAESVGGEWLPERFGGRRAFSTAIQFLLAGEEFSALHCIKSDELWHFYAGRPLVIHIIDSGGSYRTVTLGSDPDQGEVFQATVEAGSWFGASLLEAETYALVGCTVAPGFDFDDFEMGQREELCRLYPEHEEMIKSLTRG